MADPGAIPTDFLPGLSPDHNPHRAADRGETEVRHFSPFVHPTVLLPGFGWLGR